MIGRGIFRAMLAPLLAVPGLAAAQPSPPGERAFKLQCAACHSIRKGEPHRVGPNLQGIGGETAGVRAGYMFSPAMAASGIVWTPENLDRFLERPQAVVKGTKMTFAGISDPARRRELVAYLLRDAD